AGASDSEAVTISNVPARTNTVSNPEAVTSATAKGKTIKDSKKDAVIQEAPTSDFTANATYNKDTGLEGATDIKLTVTTAVWKNTADVTANVGAEVDIYSAATCTGYVVPNATSKAVVTKSPKVEAVDAIVPLTMLANSTNNASAATILACLNTNTPTVGIRYENGTNFEQVPVTWTVDIADTFDAKGKTYHFTANVKGVSGADIKTSVTVKPITVTGTSYPELAAKSTRTVPFTGVKFATMDAVLGFTTPTAETKGAFKGNITTDATSPAVEIPYTVDYTVATTPANAIGEFGADPLALTKDFIGVVTYGDANVIPAWLTIPAGITLPAENAKVTKTVTLLAKAPVPEAKIINFPGADKMVVTQKDNSPSVGNKIAIYSADGKTLEYEATIKEQAVEGKFIIDIPSAEISAKGGKYVLKTLVGTLASEPVTVSVKAEPELVAKPTVVTVNKTLNLSFDTNISGFTVRDVTNAYTTNSNIIYVKANDGKVTMTGKKSGNTDIYIDATLVDNETKLQMDVSGMTDRLICNNSGSGSGGGGGGRPAPTTPPVPTATPTPTPTPTAAPDGYFDDIDDVKWAKEQIDKLAKLGFVNGVADRTFAPNNNVTRAEFTKMIVTTFGLTDTTATVDFADMTDKTAWYYQYVAAGEKAGLVKGYEEDNTFRPNAPITREEMSAMLGRACTVIGVELPKEAKPENFTDMDSIQGYAKDFVLEMQKAGIINGMGDGSFAPQANATRAQSAKIMGMIYDISSAK
ncbi:MAG: S-layer homology domain-containing protein, partial [Oscillospiraceae bacterium]